MLFSTFLYFLLILNAILWEQEAIAEKFINQNAFSVNREYHPKTPIPVGDAILPRGKTIES
jgi:hypothetical protein